MTTPPQVEGDQNQQPQNEEEAQRQRIEYASDRMKWLRALIDRGFSREEAMSLLLAPSVHVHMAPASPEQSEFLSRFSALANRALAEED